MWATPGDVKQRWLDEDMPVQDETLQVLIGDAEDQIRASIPHVDDLIDSLIPIDRVTRIVVRMVIRYLRNPTGIRTLQETTGQFSGSTTYAGDSLGEIVFTDADRRELLGKGGTRGRRAFSVHPGGIR